MQNPLCDFMEFSYKEIQSIPVKKYFYLFSFAFKSVLRKKKKAFKVKIRIFRFFF